MTADTVYFEDWGHVNVTLKGTIVRQVFTEGLCGALATALNRITGCKIIGSENHVAVITFDGRILDIEGIHTPSKFERAWGIIKPLKEKDLIYCGVDQWRKAIPFAKLLAKKYLY